MAIRFVGAVKLWASDNGSDLYSESRIRSMVCIDTPFLFSSYFFLVVVVVVVVLCCSRYFQLLNMFV